MYFQRGTPNARTVDCKSLLSRHLGSSTAANWVSFDLNVSCSSCWGYSLINTLKLKKKLSNCRAVVNTKNMYDLKELCCECAVTVDKQAQHQPSDGSICSQGKLHYWSVIKVPKSVRPKSVRNTSKKHISTSFVNRITRERVHVCHALARMAVRTQSHEYIWLSLKSSGWIWMRSEAF